MNSATGDGRNVTVVPRHSRGRRIFGYTFGLFIISVVILIIYDRTNDPVLPEFRVDSAIFSPLNTTGSELTGDWNFTFGVKNPNRKFSLSYEQLQVFVQYDDKFIISTVELPLFPQAAKNTTTIPARLSVAGAHVEDGAVSSGSLGFGVQVVARTRFSPWRWLWINDTVYTQLRCESVEFVLSQNTSSAPSTPCEYERDKLGRLPCLPHWLRFIFDEYYEDEKGRPP